MAIITRHEPTYYQPKEYVIALGAKQVADFINQIRQLSEHPDRYRIETIKHLSFRNLGYAALYTDANYVYNYLYYSNQLTRAWFTYTMNDSKPVTLQIASREIRITGKFSHSYIGALDVMEGITVAMILRDREALDFYAAIPLEFTEQATGVEDYLFELMLLFYQVIIHGSKKPQEASFTHNRLLELLDWEEYSKYSSGKVSDTVNRYNFSFRSKMVSYLYLPVLKIYYAILSQQADEYEQAVTHALLQWKEYYTLKYVDQTTEERDHSTEPAGFLALPILAACAYGYDQGMRLKTVSSDYIPDWLIRGDFAGMELLIKD